MGKVQHLACIFVNRPKYIIDFIRDIDRSLEELLNKRKNKEETGRINIKY